MYANAATCWREACWRRPTWKGNSRRRRKSCYYMSTMGLTSVIDAMNRVSELVAWTARCERAASVTHIRGLCCSEWMGHNEETYKANKQMSTAQDKTIYCIYNYIYIYILLIHHLDSCKTTASSSCEDIMKTLARQPFCVARRLVESMECWPQPEVR